MNIEEILELYMSGDIYNADALTNDMTKLVLIDIEVIGQARALVSVYSNKSVNNSPEDKVKIFNDYVTMLSISSYLNYRIKKLQKEKGGGTE